MPTDLQRLFEQAWTRTLHLPRNVRVLLAVSGGCDSMVLARLLLDAGIPHGIAHCNFSLRGAESDADEALVRSWAAAHDLPLHVTRFDTAEAAARQGAGIQETARILRYAWFETLRQENGYTHIATAHHADDSAETVLLNLFKGTGIAGLHGIRPRTGALIRPLLFASRAAIEAFAEQAGVVYREDASNAATEYTRNALRHTVVPALEHVFPGALQAVAGTANRLAEVETIYRRGVEAERKRLLEQRGADWYLPVRKLLKTEPLQTLLYELFMPFGFTAKATAGIEALLHSETGRTVESATHTVVRHRDFLVVTARAEAVAELYTIDTWPAVVRAGAFEYRLTLAEAGMPFSPDADTEQVDVRLLQAPLVLRRARAGDYFYPLGMGGKKKKLARFLTDRKASAAEKARVWVLESGRRIVWAAGYRIDERFKVTARTTAVLRLQRRPV